MRKLATWQNGENKKPNQEPDSDFQFQLTPGTVVRLKPSPLGLPRLINLPSWTQRDPLTLTTKLITETDLSGLSLDRRPAYEIHRLAFLSLNCPIEPNLRSTNIL